MRVNFTEKGSPEAQFPAGLKAEVVKLSSF